MIDHVCKPPIFVNLHVVGRFPWISQAELAKEPEELEDQNGPWTGRQAHHGGAAIAGGFMLGKIPLKWSEMIWNDLKCMYPMVSLQESSIYERKKFGKTPGFFTMFQQEIWMLTNQLTHQRWKLRSELKQHTWPRRNVDWRDFFANRKMRLCKNDDPTMVTGWNRNHVGTIEISIDALNGFKQMVKNRGALRFLFSMAVCWYCVWYQGY